MPRASSSVLEYWCLVGVKALITQATTFHCFDLGEFCDKIADRETGQVSVITCLVNVFLSSSKFFCCLFHQQNSVRSSGSECVESLKRKMILAQYVAIPRKWDLRI